MAIVRTKSRLLVGRYGFTRSDLGDIQQEVLVDLLANQKHFDSAIAERSTFVSTLVHRSIARLIRYRCQAKRDYRRCRESLDQMTEPPPRSPPPSPDDAEFELIDHSVEGQYEAVDLRVDLAEALADLPEELRTIAQSLGRENVAEISRRTGLTRSAIRHAIKRVREHLFERGITK